MRDIKFRAWDIKNKWMEDFFWVDSHGNAWDTPARKYDTPNTEIDTEDNFIVMQYTGLKDKNGVEIYESDLLRNELGRTCRVDHAEHLAGFDAEFLYQESSCCPDLSFGFEPAYWSSCCEVIGNIYENPELLEPNND